MRLGVGEGKTVEDVRVEETRVDGTRVLLTRGLELLAAGVCELLWARDVDEAPATGEVGTALLVAIGDDTATEEDWAAEDDGPDDDEGAADDRLDKMPHFPKPGWQPVPQ